MRVLLIIPAFNEQDNIINVVNNLTYKFKEFDYLIVNDCSDDKTKEIIRKNKYNHINLPVNLGLSLEVIHSANTSRGDWSGFKGASLPKIALGVTRSPALPS